MVKNLPANAGSQVRSLVREDSTGCGATKPEHGNQRKSTSSNEDPAQAAGQLNPSTATRESPQAAMKTQHSQKQ